MNSPSKCGNSNRGLRMAVSTVLLGSLVILALGVNQVNAAHVRTNRAVGMGTSSVQLTKQSVVISASLAKQSLTSISANGSTFTFSSRTGDIAHLKSGSVMLVSGIAVRKVKSVAKKAKGLIVQTTPAGLGDLIYQGQLSWNSPVNYKSALLTSESAAIERRSLRPLGETSGLTIKGKAGGYEYSMKFNLKGKDVEVEVELSREEPINVSATVTGTLDNFNTKGSIDVTKGKVTSAAVSDRGLSGSFTLGYEAKPASSLGTGGALISLPGEMRIPVIVGGIPFYIGIGVSYYVGIGFSGKSQKLTGSYTLKYDGSSGFSFSKQGATSPTGAITELGKILLNKTDAVLNGPISLILGAQMPRLEFGLGVKGASVGAYTNLVASTAVKIGGQQGGGTGGCDAREMEIEATTGADAQVFGLKIGTSPYTLFDKTYQLAYPAGCGTV